MKRLLIGGIRRRDGVFSKPFALIAVLASLLMVIGSGHAAAHMDGPEFDADCVACHIASSVAAKAVPAGEPELAIPPPATEPLALRTESPLQPVACDQIRSRGPPLRLRSA